MKYHKEFFKNKFLYCSVLSEVMLLVCFIILYDFRYRRDPERKIWCIFHNNLIIGIDYKNFVCFTDFFFTVIWFSKYGYAGWFVALVHFLKIEDCNLILLNFLYFLFFLSHLRKLQRQTPVKNCSIVVEQMVILFSEFIMS